MRSYIPTINVSSLLKTDFNNLASKNTLRKIEKACVDVGFFQITGHGLDLNQIKKTCEIGNIFFNLPESKKNNNVYRGYFPNNVNGKEGLDIGDLRVNKSYASKTRSQYIEYLDLNKCFNKNAINILKNYFDSVYELSETLFKSIIKLNRKNPDISSIAFSRLKTLSTLRFNYYPNQSKPVEISKQDGVALGCETHVDSGVFTILYQDKKGGLQVQNRNNKKWYNVPFNKNALIVNTGRALEFLSGSKFKATNHRVLWNKSKRLSVSFFFEPSYDFKMNRSFLNLKKSSSKSQIYEKFLNQSLKKFIEYQR